MDPLGIHRPPLSFQKNIDPAVTVTHTRFGNFSDTFPQGRMRAGQAKLVGALIATLILPAAVLGIYLATLHWNGNFLGVIPGELYRSVQLSPERLKTYVRANGIRTIINLRGENTKLDWYNQETDYQSFISGSRIPTSDIGQSLTILLCCSHPAGSVAPT